jgi:hypothetical protein
MLDLTEFKKNNSFNPQVRYILLWVLKIITKKNKSERKGFRTKARDWDFIDFRIQNLDDLGFIQ